MMSATIMLRFVLPAAVGVFFVDLACGCRCSAGDAGRAGRARVVRAAGAARTGETAVRRACAADTAGTALRADDYVTARAAARAAHRRRRGGGRQRVTLPLAERSMTESRG
jgi:hypothetical protein